MNLTGPSMQLYLMTYTDSIHTTNNKQTETLFLFLVATNKRTKAISMVLPHFKKYNNNIHFHHLLSWPTTTTYSPLRLLSSSSIIVIMVLHFYFLHFPPPLPLPSYLLFYLLLFFVYPNARSL